MPDLHSTQAARFGVISVNFKTMELHRANQPVGLTLQEFKILRFFVARPGVVVSRQKLITAVWRKRQRSSERTVDNHISRLRQKIENDPAHPIYLRTVHGVGYKFVPAEDSALLTGTDSASTPRLVQKRIEKL